jgi:DNA-binding transcriptional MocR family regulator
LAEDIASGALPPRTRLPPRRELAFALDVTANTTSRGYREGVAQALIKGEVGRGTFVRAPQNVGLESAPADMRRPARGAIDISRNLSCSGLAATALAKTLAALRKSGQLATLTGCQTEAGPTHHAEAAVSWLERCGVEAGADEIIVINGAQQGLL